MQKLLYSEYMIYIWDLEQEWFSNLSAFKCISESSVLLNVDCCSGPISRVSDSVGVEGGQNFHF